MLRHRPSGASQTSSRPYRTAPRACPHWSHFVLLLPLARPSAVHLFGALRARRCCWSWGFVAAVVAHAAAGVAAGGWGVGWGSRRVDGSTDQRLQVRGALRPVSRGGATGG